MVKVLRVITRLNIGGPAIHATLLSSELNKNGSYKDVLVCGKVSEREGDMMYFARDNGIRPIVIPALGRDISAINDLKALIGMFRIIRRERPDIIHTHTAKAGTIGRVAAILSGIPMIKVHTFHGHIFDGYFSPLKARIFLHIERVLAVFTDRIVTVSPKVEDEIVNKLKIIRSDRSIVIPLGLDLGKFIDSDKEKEKFRNKIGAASDETLIGIIGRLVPIKNHRMFLDAARIVKDQMCGHKIKFVIIGDGELRDYLEKYSEDLGMKSHVVFTGWIEDIAGVYAGLDIVALTSLNEGTPVSLIEAMAAGKAVIATDVGGVRDFLANEKNGILVKNIDAGCFAKEMIALLENPAKRAQIAVNARRSVVEKYSKTRLVENIKSLYQDLLRKSA